MWLKYKKLCIYIIIYEWLVNVMLIVVVIDLWIISESEKVKIYMLVLFLVVF